MQDEVDVEALFADLEKRGIEYAGDEEWHIAREAERLREARERAASDALDEEAVARNSMEAEAGAQRLLDAYESGDTGEIDRAFWGESGLDDRDLGKAEPSSPVGAVSGAPAWLVKLDDEEASASGDDEAWVEEALNASVPEPRWTYAGLQAYHYMRRRRQAMLDARRRVFTIHWDESAHSGASASAKNLPFFVKGLEGFEGRESYAPNEEEEVFLPRSPGPVSVLPLERGWQPSWSKLPGVTRRSQALQELVSGARFASVARDDADLFSWFWQSVGDDVCCTSIELSGEAARRFLAAKKGDIAGGLHRGFRRQLERLLGPVALAAVWVHPPEQSQAVTLFMMIRPQAPIDGWAVEERRRSRRFYESLLRHGVVLPKKMPIETIGPHLSDYLGMTEEELSRKPPVTWEEWLEFDFLTDDPRVRGIVDYRPESGLPTDKELAEHAERSDQWWVKHTQGYGLPSWFDHRFTGLLQDYFLLSPDHVRRRQKAKDALKHRQGKTTPTERRRLRSLLSQLLGTEMGIEPAISYFRASPACFAALVSRSGQVLGEYCDKRHKAGRAREMYEELRKEVAS